MSILKGLLRIDPSVRLSASAAMKNPLFTPLFTSVKIDSENDGDEYSNTNRNRKSIVSLSPLETQTEEKTNEVLKMLKSSLIDTASQLPSSFSDSKKDLPFLKLKPAEQKSPAIQLPNLKASISKGKLHRQKSMATGTSEASRLKGLLSPKTSLAGRPAKLRFATFLDSPKKTPDSRGITKKDLLISNILKIQSNMLALTQRYCKNN